MLALLVSLGRWQVDRAHEKEERQALLDARMDDAPLRLTGSVPTAEPLLFRRVLASGEWLAERARGADPGPRIRRARLRDDRGRSEQDGAERRLAGGS